MKMLIFLMLFFCSEESLAQELLDIISKAENKIKEYYDYEYLLFENDYVEQKTENVYHIQISKASNIAEICRILADTPNSEIPGCKISQINFKEIASLIYNKSDDQIDLFFCYDGNINDQYYEFLQILSKYALVDAKNILENQSKFTNNSSKIIDAANVTDDSNKSMLSNYDEMNCKQKLIQNIISDKTSQRQKSFDKNIVESLKDRNTNFRRKLQKLRPNTNPLLIKMVHSEKSEDSETNSDIHGQADLNSDSDQTRRKFYTRSSPIACNPPISCNSPATCSSADSGFSESQFDFAMNKQTKKDEKNKTVCDYTVSCTKNSSSCKHESLKSIRNRICTNNDPALPNSDVDKDGTLSRFLYSIRETYDRKKMVPFNVKCIREQKKKNYCMLYFLKKEKINEELRKNKNLKIKISKSIQKTEDCHGKTLTIQKETILNDPQSIKPFRYSEIISDSKYFNNGEIEYCNSRFAITYKLVPRSNIKPEYNDYIIYSFTFEDSSKSGSYEIYFVNNSEQKIEFIINDYFFTKTEIQILFGNIRKLLCNYSQLDYYIGNFSYLASMDVFFVDIASINEITSEEFTIDLKKAEEKNYEVKTFIYSTLKMSKKTEGVHFSSILDTFKCNRPPESASLLYKCFESDFTQNKGRIKIESTNKILTSNESDVSIMDVFYMNKLINQYIIFHTVRDMVIYRLRKIE